MQLAKTVLVSLKKAKNIDALYDQRAWSVGGVLKKERSQFERMYVETQTANTSCFRANLEFSANN